MSIYDVDKTRIEEFISELQADVVQDHKVIVDICDRDDGKHDIVEVWQGARSQTHRKFGPAITRIDGETGNVVSMEWWENGERHRVSGPAVIDFDPTTGEPTREEFYVNGHKIDPANLSEPQIGLK